MRSYAESQYLWYWFVREINEHCEHARVNGVYHPLSKDALRTVQSDRFSRAKSKVNGTYRSTYDLRVCK